MLVLQKKEFLPRKIKTNKLQELLQEYETIHPEATFWVEKRELEQHEREAQSSHGGGCLGRTLRVAIRLADPWEAIQQERAKRVAQLAYAC